MGREDVGKLPVSLDYTRIRRGELIAAIGALALFVVMFLRWYSFSGSNRTRFLLVAGGKPLPLTGTAWHVYSNTSLLLIGLVIVVLALPVVTATQQKIDFPLAAVATGLGLLVTVVLIYKLFISQPGGNTYSEVAYGGYIGLVAIIAMTLGAYLTAREDGVRRIDTDPQPAMPPTGDPGAGPDLPPRGPAPPPGGQ